jgi:hypothetical protein
MHMRYGDRLYMTGLKGHNAGNICFENIAHRQLSRKPAIRMKSTTNIMLLLHFGFIQKVLCEGESIHKRR